MPSSQKLRIWLKPNCTWMFIGWSSTNCTFFVLIWNSKWRLWLVVYRSSETSTNQSDVIIRSDDRFLNLVVDSGLTLFGFFFCLHTDKNIAVLSQLVFLPSYWQTSGNFVQAYFWHSVNTHIWTSLLLVHLDQRSRWTIAITWRLSSVVCRLNFSHFKLLLRNHWADWNQT
jgi:hypothetical protein